MKINKFSLRLLLFHSFIFSTLLFNCSYAYDFAIINTTNVREVNNIYEMFKNLGITYKILSPSQVTDDSVFSDVKGIISFIDEGSNIKNASAVINFANNHVVISHGYDFAKYYFPAYSESYVKVVGITVNYTRDWGNFRKNDRVQFHREDGTFYAFSSGLLGNDSTIVKIAQFDDTRIAFFQKKGLIENSGFYVLDLKITRNGTEWSGIWHIFPVVKLVKDFPTGRYAMWMSDGISWWDIDWVNNFTTTLANNNPDIVSKIVIGRSLEGRNISAIIIGKGDRCVIIDGAIHGDEKISTFASLRFAEMIVDAYRNGGYWYDKLQELKIIIVPILNPDGFVHNWRQNARSYLYPSDYQKSGYIMAVNNQWVAHTIPSEAKVENLNCSIIPQDPTINGTVLNVDNTHFQVGLIYASSGLSVTTPTKIYWSCNATCCNLNRDFPPGSDASEPETQALISLINNYTPIIYINGHEGGHKEYNKFYYASSLREPYMSFAKQAVNFSKTIFTGLRHWGFYTEENSSYWLGNVDLGECCTNVFAPFYPAWKYNTISFLVETVVWSGAHGAKQHLYGFDYYLSFYDSIISHLDVLREHNFLVHSTAKIKSFKYDDNQLLVELDDSETKLPTQTIIFLGDYGKPTSVKIDKTEKPEGSGWIYYPESRNITLTGYFNSITLSWQGVPYTVTFSQKGVPSGIMWGVTVNGARYTSSTNNLTVFGLLGAMNYSYDSLVFGKRWTRYSCTLGCTGIINSTYTMVSANYKPYYFDFSNLLRKLHLLLRKSFDLPD